MPRELLIKKDDFIKANFQKNNFTQHSKKKSGFMRTS